MNCRKINNLLSAYIDGELPGVEHRLIHEHLAYCELCRAEHEGLLHTKRMLARLRVQEPTHDLPASILQKIHTGNDRQMRSETWRDWLRRSLSFSSPTSQGWALGAGVALAGLFFLTRTLTPAERIKWAPADPAKLAADPAPATMTFAAPTSEPYFSVRSPLSIPVGSQWNDPRSITASVTSERYFTAPFAPPNAPAVRKRSGYSRH